MPIVIGIFCLLPLGIGFVLEYLCCRVPKRRIWRALPPALSVLFVVIVGVGRWNMWTSEEVSPVTQLILFPGDVTWDGGGGRKFGDPRSLMRRRFLQGVPLFLF